jgi:hypothetical protein
MPSWPWSDTASKNVYVRAARVMRDDVEYGNGACVIEVGRQAV